MIDPVQAVLLFVIVLLTVLFVVLGIQVFFILRDFRETVQRTNNILDDVENITDKTSNAVDSVSGVVGGVTSVKVIADVLSIFRKKRP